MRHQHIALTPFVFICLYTHHLFLFACGYRIIMLLNKSDLSFVAMRIEEELRKEAATMSSLWHTIQFVIVNCVL